ncbi:hypothetical protein [Arenibacter troitsensis]|uniref:Uncharacterized protein n=1 Tax=Arenibacter troitsensis TaxID=188872 RepID=A0A1X7L766_9FLAO|nr:hypothetical protein [Arenibacter troitsensis]SMG49718.1 hypothetical protein SAMN03080602_03865 [Arenibacter troitsensis]
MKVRNVQELQDIFNTSLSKAKNKEIIIENELKQIDVFLHTQGSNNYRKEIINLIAEHDNLNPNFDRINWLYFTKGDFDTFHRYYDDYLIQEIESPLPVYEFNNEISQEEINGFFEEIKRIRKQAIELAKYTIWLKALKSTNNSKPQKKNNTLSQKQKLLALHYLGLDFRKQDYIKSAKVLQEIYGHHFEDSRKLMPMLYDTNNSLKTSDNLRSVLNLFKSIGFTDAVEDIQKDLDNCTNNS